jgi:hypothetical protein
VEVVISKGVLVRLPGAVMMALAPHDQISRTLLFDDSDTPAMRLSAMTDLLEPDDKIFTKVVYIDPVGDLDPLSGTEGAHVECSMIMVRPAAALHEVSNVQICIARVSFTATSKIRFTVRCPQLSVPVARTTTPHWYRSGP